MTVQPIRILVADDHPVVRQGIRQIIAETPDLTVVAEAVDGREVLDSIGSTTCDLVLLDLSMPGTDGIELLKHVKRQRPELRVLILTMHSEDQFAIRALKAGASGYLTKESAPAELVQAVRRVVAGGKYISPWLAERLAAHLGPDSEKPPHEKLSDREYQVLRLIAAGKTTREIAQTLSLSAKTVATYRARVFEKMNMRSAAELAAYAVRHRLAD
jgi:two-component system invasion response regulator UvrY